VISFEENPKQLMDEWPYWKEKIIQFAKAESTTRPYVKKLLGSLENSDDFANKDGMYVL